MAFDRPLEADKVEDNILISLVKGPIIGTLMWIIGDNSDEAARQLANGLQDMMLDDDNSSSNGLDDETRMDELKSLPRMVRSDVSVAGMNNDNPQETLPRCLGAASFDAMTSSSSNNNNNNKSNIPRMEKKKMSWCDNLVEYMDNESTKHEPPSAGPGSSSSSAKPIKSAMTRSASRHLRVGPASEDNERKFRYLPNGLDRAHNGLIMPTRPGGHDHHHGNEHHGNGNGNGVESPSQWGWYMNITPPTPEMYHSRSSLKHSGRSDNTSSTAFSTTSSDGNTFDHSATRGRGPNHVFQGLKAGSNRQPMGWPSVPL